MVVEIDPSDVVSVPHDCDCQKLRTSKYKVVGHYETIDAPPLPEYDELARYVDWDDDIAEEYDAGYEAGYEAAKQSILDNLKNN